jgi:hypothetical protein
MSGSASSSLPAFASVGDLWPEIDGLTYSEANAEGRERSDQLIEIMRKTDCPAVLGFVVEAIVKAAASRDSAELSGVEIGFFHNLALALMQAPVVEFVDVAREPRFNVAAQLGCLRVVG